MFKQRNRLRVPESAIVNDVVRLSRKVCEAVAALPEGYLELLDHISGALMDDQRVRGLWLSGSVARGVADAGSDLDLVVTVGDAAIDHWVETLPALLDREVAPVIVIPIAGMPGSWACTTAACRRVDIVSETVSQVSESPFTRRLVVFDRGSLASRVPAPADQVGPDTDRLFELVSEFYRLMAIFPAACVAREDWLLGQEGAHALRGLLYQLLVELNQPLPAMGIKQWSAKLTMDQQAVMAALPQASPNRDSVVATTRLLGQVFTRYARPALKSAGRAWPDQAEAAVTNYWVKSGLSDKA